MKTRVEDYKVLDTIEETKIQTIQNNLLEIICNIEDNISPGIIGFRVDHIKLLIEQL